MLLTNCSVTQSRKSLWRIVEGYLSRWLIEEAIRFAKQSYNLEDIRVLDWDRLKNMMGILLLTLYFISVHLGTQLRLKILSGHIVSAAKRFYGVSEFCYYALADGVRPSFAFGYGGAGETYALPPVSISRKEAFSFGLARKLLAHYDGTPLHLDMKAVLGKIAESLEGEVTLEPDWLSEHVDVLPEDRVRIDPELWGRMVGFIERRETIKAGTLSGCG